MKLLIIDDNAAVRTSLRMILAKDFDQIAAVGDPRLIPALLEAGNIDAVLLDMNFDNARLDCSDGLFWLSRIKGMPHAPAVVVVTAFGDVPIAVEAMKLGAEDFITKPWDNDDLRVKLTKAMETNRRARSDARAVENARLLEEREDRRLAMSLEEMKKEHILSIVEQNGGNLSAAAARLGINRQTLYNMLSKIQRK